MALPQTIKSIYQPDYKSQALELRTLPLPARTRPTDHLVRVQAFAPTNDELGWAAKRPQFYTDKEPVPGTDLAGVVVEAPEGSPFPAGSRVFGLMDFFRAGAGREYTVTEQYVLAHLPENVPFVDGAAVPMGALTAWQNLFVHGGLSKEGLYGEGESRAENAKKRVVVVGAGGGVGTWAVQLAALAGAEVVGVASGSKEELVRSLGATSFIDYTKTTIAEYMAAHPGKQADLVLDLVGGPARQHQWSAVKDGGILVTIVLNPELKVPEGLGRDVKAVWTLVDRDGDQLAEIGRLVADGKVKVILDTVYGFDEYQAAFDRVMGGKSTGRVVVKVADE